MPYKFGKLPARPGAIQLKLDDYIAPRVLPTPPESFGHDHLVKEWLMLDNDKVGNCVLAGAAHEHMLWNAVHGRKVNFSGRSVTWDYGSITGYRWWLPGSDRGTDMQEAARYRQRTGLIDTKFGIARHKIGAYVLIKKGDVAQHNLAAFLFGAIGIGVRCPESMEDQFQRGHPFQYAPGDKIVGGHYMSNVNRRNKMIGTVTWGKVHPMTPEFLEAYNDESIAYVSSEMLSGGETIDGFNYRQLLSDLEQVQRRE